MSSTQSCNIATETQGSDSRMAVKPVRSGETETATRSLIKLSPENAEISTAIPGLGEQIEEVDEMPAEDVEELLEGIDEWEELIDMREEAKRKAKLLARLKLADKSVRCAHIKANNEPCGSPAMNGDTFCYFHSEARKLRDAEQTVAKAAEIPVLEDMHGVQLAIMRVCSLLAANKIEEGTARAMFEGLRLAQKAVNEHRLKLA